MEKDFIPPTESLALKELGFDELCFSYYNAVDNELSFVHGGHNQISFRRNSQFGIACSAPTYSQAFRWFRKNYSLFPHVEIFSDDKFDYTIVSKIFSKEEDYLDGRFDTYEEAELTCLRRLIELVKNNG
jgi:hypothetical protein